MFRSHDLVIEDGLRWLRLASSDASELYDDESWMLLVARHVELARAVGALSVLPLTLHSQAVAHALAGELGTAAALVAELDAVQQATGVLPCPGQRARARGRRGHEQEVDDLIAASVRRRRRARGGRRAARDPAVVRGAGQRNGRYADAALAAQEAAALAARSRGP